MKTIVFANINELMTFLHQDDCYSLVVGSACSTIDYNDECLGEVEHDVANGTLTLHLYE